MTPFRCAAAFLLTAFLMPQPDSVAQIRSAPVRLSAALRAADPVLPGADVVVEIVADVTTTPDSRGKHWHIYPRQEQHQGVEIPTSITVEGTPSALVSGDVAWPATKIIRNAAGEFQPAYEGRTVFTLPVKVADDALPGNHRLHIAFRYQTCASQCLSPTTENLSVTIVVAGDSTENSDSAVVPRVDEEQPAPAATGSEQIAEADHSSGETVTGDPSDTDSTEDFSTNVFGTQFGFSAGSAFAVPLLLLFAFVGGFLLNLTPCVLPIIPIKIIGLTKSAHGDTRRTKVLGVAMGLGILAFWLAIGAAISFVSGFDSISSLFQRPVFGITVGLFIAFMGIGMLIDMTIQLPQSVHRINPRHDTLHGAFLFGVMTAVLSTPCTAPFMGSAAAWATKADSSPLVLAVFTAIAAGMGWPYVLLSWFPQLVSKVPRTGPASVLVKQVMGLLMLSVAAFFGGTGVLGLVKEHPHLGPVLHWWVATAFVGAMAVWLSLETFRITKSPTKRIAYSLLSLALFAGMVMWSNGETADSWDAMVHQESEADAMLAYVAQLEAAVRNGSGEQVLQLRPPPWRDFDPEVMARAKANGQVAIVHFTADW